MSLFKNRPKEDAKSADPIIGYLLLNVNSTPVIKRPVSQSLKTDVTVELTQMASQIWKLFGVACSLSLEFCSTTDDSRDFIVNFTR